MRNILTFCLAAGISTLIGPALLAPSAQSVSNIGKPMLVERAEAPITQDKFESTKKTSIAG